MSLLSGAKRFFNTAVGKKVATGLDYLSAAYTDPLTFITNPSKAKEQSVARAETGTAGVFANVGRTLATTATVVTAVVLGGAALGSGTAKTILSKSAPIVAKVATSAIKHPLTTGLYTAGGIVGYNIVTSSNKAADLVLSTPEKLATTGKDLGNIIDEPSLDKAVAFIKAHPGSSATFFLTALGVLGYSSSTILSLISNHQNTEAVKENTNATKQSQDQSNSSTYIPPMAIPTPEPSSIPPSPEVVAPLGLAPSGEPAKKTTKKKKKAVKKKKKTRRSKKKTTKKKKKAVKKKKKTIKRRKTRR